jgi:hypothetical protein
MNIYRGYCIDSFEDREEENEEVIYRKIVFVIWKKTLI